MARHFIVSCLALVCTLVLAVGAMADGALRDLSWHVLAGGGGRSTSTSFVLSATIGQASVGQLSGGSFVLRGGFWPGVEGGAVGPTPSPTQPVTPGAFRTYLPILLRD